MIGWLILAVVLFVICAILIVAEILLPSFGLLTIASLSCFVGGMAIFFQYDMPGTGILAAAVVVPITLVISYKWFPKSRLGKDVLLDAEIKKPGYAIPDSDRLKALPGKIGVVISALRPVGRCDIEGKKYECVAENGYLDKGVEIEVISVESSQVTVREIKKS